jgi:hypothetical protein
MNQANEIANATVIYGVPINYKDEVYQHAIDF